MRRDIDASAWKKSPNVAERSQFRQPLHLHRVVRQQTERHDRTGKLMKLDLHAFFKIPEKQPACGSAWNRLRVGGSGWDEADMSPVLGCGLEMKPLWLAYGQFASGAPGLFYEAASASYDEPEKPPRTRLGSGHVE
jgi:hypothetical protein